MASVIPEMLVSYWVLLDNMLMLTQTDSEANMQNDRGAGLDDLVVQMRMTNAILAAMLQRQHDLSQKDVIALLADARTPAVEIAAALGTSVNTVRVSLSKSRKRTANGKDGSE